MRNLNPSFKDVGVIILSTDSAWTHFGGRNLCVKSNELQHGSIKNGSAIPYISQNDHH